MTDDDQYHSQSRSLDVDVREVAACDETVSTEHVDEWLIDRFPHDTAWIWEVGSGSERDVGWLATPRGRITAVDPDSAMRKESDRWRPDNLRLLPDCLLDL